MMFANGGRNGAATRVLVILALLVVYPLWTSAFGLYGPDEPRYASIARQMAASGDWITPVLDGEPWLEKPPLLYWMGAAGYRLGLGPEAAVRVPLGLLSVWFLLIFEVRLRRLLGGESMQAAMICATAAGWIAYSNVAITDVPMAICFSMAMLDAADWCVDRKWRQAVTTGLWMGLAVLAKGLVPLVLAVPALWFLRKNWRQWSAALAALLVAAGPWYWAIWQRQGWAFVDEFFLEHHFSRFASSDLQHVQPVWFYAPVALGLLAPWTPLLFTRNWTGTAVRYFAVWAGWGFLFFSASTNKLPGYLLPLVPAAAVVMAAQHWHPLALRISTGLAAAMLAFVAYLPELLRGGHTGLWLAAAAFLAGCAAPSRKWAPAALVLLSVFLAKTVQIPEVDGQLTARELARNVGPDPCAHEVPRNLRYGLHYYAGRVLGDCWEMPGAHPVHPPGILPAAAVPGPRYAVTLSADIAPAPMSGWLLVFAKQGAGEGMVLPENEDPNAVWLAARRVIDWKPGQTVTIDPQRMAFPGPIFNAGAGKWRFTAVLDLELNFPYHGLTAGDLVSETVEIASFDPVAAGRHSFLLDRRADVPPSIVAGVSVTSRMLSRFHRREVHLEADVVAGTRPGRVLVLHGFGQTRGRSALRDSLLQIKDRPELIFLNCVDRFGYHAFADSDVNGPWAQALVEELLPALGGTEKFGLLGEDFGGWGALYLKQRYPDRFARAAALGPDPLDLSNFFGVNLRSPVKDIYRDANGKRRPLYGAWSFEESAIRETVLGPQSGRWESWEAVFGLRTSEGISRQLFDRERGEVDDLVRRAWLRFDLAAKGLPRESAVFGPGEVAAALASLQSK